MPAIKLKKATQEYLAEKEREAKRDAEQAAAAAAKTSKPEEPPPKAPPKPQAKPPAPEIVTEKRKRTIPPQELRLTQWLEENIEKKDGITVSLPSLYECYTDMCQVEKALVVDVTDFNKHIKDKFGKTFGLTETSAYQGIVKEKKLSDKKPKVQGETLNLKMKDILMEVINEAGNPIKGIRFFTLKQLVASKYPALQVEIYPNKLLSALQRGMRFGQIRLVKGTGKCGYYRIPMENEAELEEEERKREREEKKMKKEKKEKEKEEGKESSGEADEKSDDKAGETKPKSRGKKRKSAEMENDGKEGENKEEDGEGQKKKKKSKKHKKKKVIREIWVGTSHSDPKKIEDTFPLAITYMGDPKDASLSRIKKYLQDHYNDVDLEKLKKALERGEDKGYWDRVSGSGGSGSFRLQIDEFDPANSESYEDKICQAIVAGHEPKQCSAQLIKQYVMDYHPEFNIDKKPHLFKKSLERAVSKNKIRQLSGIGASGTFQLVEAFYPSPAILAGEADEITQIEDIDDSADQETYIVRKTKSGRMGGLHTAKDSSTKQRRR